MQDVFGLGRLSGSSVDMIGQEREETSLFKGKLDWISVGRCNVGRCVVATRAIRASIPVGRVTGRVMTSADYGSSYCIDLSDDSVLEPAAPFRFLNHSCDPNCELVLWKVPQGGRKYTLEIWLHTLKKVAADEELTIDYAWPADVAIPCQCNSASCRGWVVDREELPLIKDRTAKRRPRKAS